MKKFKFYVEGNDYPSGDEREYIITAPNKKQAKKKVLELFNNDCGDFDYVEVKTVWEKEVKK